MVKHYFYVDVEILLLYILAMKKQTDIRIGVGLTKSDLAVIKKLKAKLQPLHGPLGYTGIIRLALRSLEHTK